MTSRDGGDEALQKRGDVMLVTAGGVGALLTPLLTVVQRQLDVGALGEGVDAAQVLDREICALQKARAAFIRWVDGLIEGEGLDGANPTQFLRAWNDSTRRLMQLLEARRRLAESSSQASQARIVDAAYKLLEEEEERLRCGGIL